MAKSKTASAVAPRIDPQYCCYRLRAAESKIHRWGVYADQSIPANRKVIEYRGEVIGPKEAKRRGKTPYLFVLDDHWTIDGAWEVRARSWSITPASPIWCRVL